jgi:hypothetical protein
MQHFIKTDLELETIQGLESQLIIKTLSILLYLLITNIDISLAVAKVHALDNNGLSTWVAVEYQAEGRISDCRIYGSFCKTFLGKRIAIERDRIFEAHACLKVDRTISGIGKIAYA